MDIECFCMKPDATLHNILILYSLLHKEYLVAQAFRSICANVVRLFYKLLLHTK